MRLLLVLLLGPELVIGANVESDEEHVRQAKRGDIAAFGSLCQRYERTGLAIGLSMTGDIHHAEDVVQNAMFIAFKKIQTLNDGPKFGSWFLTIVRRQSIEHIRRCKRVVCLDSSGASMDSLDDSSSIDSGTRNTWIEREYLVSLVLELPEAEQVLVGLRYFDGHMMTEIAEITQRPLGTVTKQISRAISRLRNRLLGAD